MTNTIHGETITMKKLLAPALLAASLVITGCSSTSDEEKASMDRFQYMNHVTAQMDELGYDKVTVLPGADEFFNIAASIAERQVKVMQEYRTQAENHADVQAFLYAHRESTPEQLKLAIVEFDATAPSEDQKIAAKIAAYNAALESVREANAKLLAEIVLEGGKAAYILAQYNSDIAQAMALSSLGGLMGGGEQTPQNNVFLALERAKDHLALATEASELISIDEETIEAINALQTELEAKS